MRGSFRHAIDPSTVEVGLFTCLVMTGVLAAANPLALVAGNVGANLLSPLIGAGWRSCCNTFLGHSEVAGDTPFRLMRSMLIAAFTDAITCLEDEWRQADRHHTRHRSKAEQSAMKALFAQVRADGATVLVPARLDDPATADEVRHLLGDDASEAKWAIDVYLEDLGARFPAPAVIAYLAERLVPETTRRFTARLYAEGKDTTPVWRAYLEHSLESLRLQQAQSLDVQRQILAAVERYGELSAQVRDSLIEAVACQVHTDVVTLEESLKTALLCSLQATEERIVREILAALDQRIGQASDGTGTTPGSSSGQKMPLPPAVTPAWNVPLPRNANFTGRETDLAALRAAFTRGDPLAHIHVLHGLGGVGKTRLAAEYAYRYAAEYRVVWWVTAEEPTTLAAGLAALAGQLGLPQATESDQSVIVEAVQRWLSTNAGWLLILDNARSPSAVQSYLPQTPTGHVLVTSRNPNWRRTARVFPVKGLDEPAGVRYLLHCTGDDDAAAAARLVRLMSGLPLALVQAAAYIEATGMPLVAYLRLFEERTGQHALIWRHAPDADDPATIATIWNLSMEQVRVASSTAATLLNLCAFLAPDDVPRDLLTDHVAMLPPPLIAAAADPLWLDDAVAVLRGYSLLETETDGAMAIHRLVQAVTRDRMSGQEQQILAMAAVRVMAAAFPDDGEDVRTWSTCERLLPHVLAATSHADALGVAPDVVGLLNRAGLYLKGRAQFGEASSLLEHALTIAEAAHGPRHPAVAALLTSRGRVLRDLADLQSAKACVERGLAIREVVRGPGHPDVATSLNVLGRIFRDLGDFAEARVCHERALAIRETVFGRDHPEVAASLNNLGRVLRLLGELPEAQAYLVRALAIDERAYGPDHPFVSDVLTSLGRTLRVRGDLVGARTHLERALAIREAVYGPNHPEVAASLSYLGRVLRETGHPADAREYLERALAIDEAAYERRHPNLATVLLNLGDVLFDLGESTAARGCLERALMIREAMYGHDHPDVAMSLHHLGVTVAKLGDEVLAQELIGRAVRIYRARLGEGHMRTVKVQECLETLLSGETESA